MKRFGSVKFVIVNYPDLVLEEDRIRGAIGKMMDSIPFDANLYPEIIQRPRQMEDVVRNAHFEGADALVVYVPTFVWAGRFIQALRKCTIPIILWSENVASSFPLEGNLLIHGSLGQVGVKSEIVYGNADDAETVHKLSTLLHAAHVKKALADSRFGYLGGVSMEINTGIGDPLEWMRLFGIDTIFIEQQEIVREGEKFAPEQVEEMYENLKKRFGSVVPFDRRFDHAIRIYLGYKKVIEKYDIDFGAVKCIFDLSDHYASACLAQGLLNEEGFVTACCGESNAAITMYMLRLMCDDPMMMADVAHVDCKNKRLHLLCDGAASPAVAASDADVSLNYQNEIESKAGGICETLIGKPGRVTIAKFAKYHGKFVLHLATGEAFTPDDTTREECGFATWPHLHVKLDGDPEKVIENNMGQYTVCCYGDHKDKLEAVAKYLDIEILRS